MWARLWAVVAVVACLLVAPLLGLPTGGDAQAGAGVNLQVESKDDLLADSVKQLMHKVQETLSLGESAPEPSAAAVALGSDNATFPIERVFVLNLNRSSDRWAVMSQRLGDAGWPFERFDAVDGAELFGTDIDAGSELASQSIHSPKQLTPSERGNFLSYQKLFQHIVDANISRALIVEDDAEFLPDVDHSPRAINAYVAQLDAVDPAWDVAWLTWYPVRDLMMIKWAFPEFQTLFEEFRSDDALNDHPTTQPNVVQTGPSLGLWSFVVSLEGARKMLEFFSVQDAETDLQIARLNLAYGRVFKDPCTLQETTLPDMRMYGFHPQLFKAHDTMDLLNLFGSSTIGAKRFLVHHRENMACALAHSH